MFGRELEKERERDRERQRQRDRETERICFYINKKTFGSF